MKRNKCICLTLIAAMLVLIAAAAAADGGREWLYSQLSGYVQLAQYAGGYDGYVSVDGYGGVTSSDPYYVTVISKSASVWSEPRTNSKKIASASHGDALLCRADGETGEPLMRDGFYAVEYKGKDGYVNADYVVNNDLTITLLESNVPAYIAPDARAKKVGSLSKLTKYRVIGFYDDFYIVNLRGAAAAYIPMSARHRDNTFDRNYHGGGGMREKAEALGDTPLRTGPGESYPEIRRLRAGDVVEVFDIIDGWYMIHDEDTGEWAFIEPGMLDEGNLCFGGEWEENG